MFLRLWHCRTTISQRSNSWVYNFKNEIKTILKANYHYAYGDNYSKIFEHSGIEKTFKVAVKYYIERIALFFTDNPVKLKCLYIFGHI